MELLPRQPREGAGGSMIRYTRATVCLAAAAFGALDALAGEAQRLSQDFVYLRDLAPSIAQDMRYAGAANFTGKTVPGYEAAECVLQRGAAEALARAQEKARARGLSLKVYDCYRPVRAVHAFVTWAGAPEDGRTKGYYPRLDKSRLVPGYIASRSQHSTGFAVDLTIGPATASAEMPGQAGGGDCTGAGPDAGSLDMGTAFDCFDAKANTDSAAATAEQRRNRVVLVSLLEGAGFKNYASEWWHFSYPGSARAYDFPVVPAPAR